MKVANPLAKTKGAGTTFWLYTGSGDAFKNPLADDDWLRLAGIKDLQPGEMSADAEDDDYLDDENADLPTGKAPRRGRKASVTPRPRWPGNPVRPDRKNWLSCLTPAKFAPSVSGILTGRLMCSAAG